MLKVCKGDKMAGPTNSKKPVSGGKCTRQLKGNQSHLHQRKKLFQEVKLSTKAKFQPRALSKKPIRGSILQEKVTDSAMGPQTFQV